MSRGQIRLLERSGIQYVCLERVRPAEDSIVAPAVFHDPSGGAKRLPAEDFFPHMITPVRGDDGHLLDAEDNPIPGDKLFEVPVLDALDAFRDKWLPLPYAAITHRGGVHEIECNDWVRVFYTRSHEQSAYGNEYDVVLCVDTQAPHQSRDLECCSFLSTYLNRPIGLCPTGKAFWNSTPLKTWIEKLGETIVPKGPCDIYPAFSHFLTLLKVLEGVLPLVEISEAIGNPLDVHLFLDVGNSRTCGILVENRPGTPLKPESAFEKLRIRDPGVPNRVWSEPFETRCMFMPSPFDSAYHDTVWTPNFRSPSMLRIGESVRQELGEFDPSTPLFGRSTLSSPKRYLWSEAPNPSPWYFAAKPEDGSIPLITGDILAELGEDGVPKWLTRAPMPVEPCFPHSSIMMFFILEVMCQAFSFINSSEYRSRKPDPLCKRMLRSIIVTSPNGMVNAERQLYRKRVSNAVDLFWKFYGLPEDSKPAVLLGYDEATCVQLVYVYSVIKDKLRGGAPLLFEHVGRDRVDGHGRPMGKTVRIAGIDIGGGTSDLMITEYRDTAKGAVTQIHAQSLFQEGVCVAGDDVVRNIIKELILPGFVKWADSWYGPGEIRLDHLETFFGLPHYSHAPEFVEMKKRFMDLVWIPMAYKYLEHAQSKEGEDLISKNYIDFEFYPSPKDQLKEFFTKTLADIIGPGRGIFPILDETVWEMDRQAINDVVYNTLYQTLRIFSEVIVQYNCDLVLMAGKMSGLPEARNILVDFCPVPPHRIISLTNFDAGKWYPFDLDRDRIKDAKTTVAVGAALWFFAEELRSLPMFGLRTDRELLDKSTIFIGQVADKLVKDKDVMFPKGARSFSLVGTTYLGARRIDCEDSHANMLYEVYFGGTADYTTPLSITLRQDAKDKSQISIVQAVDAKGKSVTNLRIQLRTLEEDLHWVDQGSV
ncbi:MAG: virulence factor SrfB [Pseudomonadota bacterium]